MSKRIVLCCDGTWDKKSNQTNVYRLSNALPTSADQIGFYDNGVGANGLPVDKLLGGAFGLGLFDKVKSGYTQIAHVYQPDDQIFLFGFSRGAYTARSIAGMIAICGLPTKKFDNAFVDSAFQAYRDKEHRDALLAQLNATYAMYNAKITMVGVWDTVGSLGIPAIFGGVSPILYGFLDTSLHPDVLNAYQAVSIDEQRAEFPPTLWTSQSAPGQTMEQVWFCGVHSDVGGGEPPDKSATSTLSDITLAWMLNKACGLGLEVNSDIENQYALPLDPKYALDTLHASWNPLWGFPRRRSIVDNAAISDSVVVRCGHENGYRPPNLKLEDGIPSPSYSITRVVSQAAAAR